jgi:hypothetical protein
MTEVILQFQATNDQMNTYGALNYFVHRRRRFKPVLEAWHSLWPARSLICDVHLNRWTEIQENSRIYELELREPGLKFTLLKLNCVL